jgi:hypothetical protein
VTDVLELINEVREAGVILRADPPDLIIRPAGIVRPELKSATQTAEGGSPSTARTRSLNATVAWKAIPRRHSRSSCNGVRLQNG